MKTKQERRNQMIRYSILGILTIFIVILLINPEIREKTLEFLSIAELLKNTPGQGSGLALTIVALIFLIENMEKMHFIWEMGHKLLGIDLEELALKQSEFIELPENYVRRPPLENNLKNALKPAQQPKLIVVDGVKNSGKTTITHYVIQHLPKRIRAHTIIVRGDFSSIERRPEESEQHAKQRLIVRIFRRIIKGTKIPGDVGDTLPMMQKAVQEYFEDEQEMWLIIIDQIDDPSFLFNEILPYLYGAKNMILVNGAALKIPESAYIFTESAEESKEKVLYQHIYIENFTGYQAMLLFKQEIHRQKGHLHHEDEKELRVLLDNALPGDIQQLSDIYVSGGGMSQVRIIRQKESGALQSRAISQSLYQQIDPNERIFFAALGMFGGDIVSANTLHFVAAACDEKNASALVQKAIDRRYIQIPEQTLLQRLNPWNPAKNITKQYSITKLGRAVANAIEQNTKHAEILLAGSAILDFFRSINVNTSEIDLQQNLPNILGIMTWAQNTSALMDSDLIHFSHTLVNVFYRGKNWETGLLWLNRAEQAALRDNLPRKLSDLQAAHARILLAQGKIKSAQIMLEKAFHANQQSCELMREDQYIGFFVTDQLEDEEYYDKLHHFWLEHLRIMAWRLTADITKKPEMLEHILPEIDTIIQKLDEHTKQNQRFSARAKEIHIELQLDKASILMTLGDWRNLQKNIPESRQYWIRSRETLQHFRRQKDISQAGVVFAQIWRSEVKYFQRSITQNTTFINRWFAFRQGSRATIKSLEYAKKDRSLFEEALTYYENCKLLQSSITRVSKPDSAARSKKIIIASLRWRRLKAIRKRLLTAYASMALYSAAAHQLLLLQELTDVSQQMYYISGDQIYKTESTKFKSSMQNIEQRLQDELPEQSKTLTPAVL